MSNKQPPRKPTAMAEDEDAPLQPPPRPTNGDSQEGTTGLPITPTPPAPVVAPSRGGERPSEEARAKIDGGKVKPAAPPSDSRIRVRPTSGTKAEKLRLASGSDASSSTNSHSPSAAATGRFPNTLNKAPYDDPSVYTSRDNNSNPPQRQGAFAVSSPNGPSESLVDNLMESSHQETAPDENANKDSSTIPLAAELASQRDLELQQEAERLRHQLEEIQGQEVYDAVPASERPPPPDETKYTRRILGSLLAFCLLVGAVVIGIIFLQPDPPPEPVSELPCVSESKIFPLGLCVGDCDFDDDCQEGLRCFQRDPNEPVPGCACALENDSRTDYCIAIEYPNIRETNEFPLGICEGDCDEDADCQDGLVCFQRNAFMEVPRCSGGEADESNNDYCIDAGPLPFLGIFGDRLLGGTDDNFGSSVSLSRNGQVLAVGAVELGSTGYVEIYTAPTPFNNTEIMPSWVPVAMIRGPRVGGVFGTHVALSSDGTIVAIGSTVETSDVAGTRLREAVVHVYQSSGDLKDWTMIGGEIFGDEYEVNGKGFEFSVDVSPDGQYVALGQTYLPSGRRTIVFHNENGSWRSLGSPFDAFRTGAKVTLATTASGNVRVAANGENSILGPGQVYVAEFDDNGEWIEVGQSLGENDGAAIALSDDGMIMALSITNRTVSVGGSGPEHVAVYRFDNATNEWLEMGVLIPIPGGDVSNEPSIALSSDGLLLAIGESWYNDVGRVRLLKYNEQVNAWQRFDNEIVGEQAGGLFGVTISMVQSSKDAKLAIGAPSSIMDRGARGSVSCYQVLRNEGDSADATFSPTGAPTTNPVTFGEVVFLKGKTDREAIGSSLELSRDGTTFGYQIKTPDSIDAVRIIKYDAYETVWSDLGTISGDEVDADFGRSLAFSGDGSILAIGIPNSNNGTTVNKGRVRALSYNGTSWDQMGADILPKAEERVECFDAVPVPDNVFCQHSGSNINGGNFGFSIAMSQDGSIIAVGSPFGYDEAGQVDVYRFEAGRWVHMGDSIIGPKKQYGKLGWSLSLSSDGLRVATGAITNGQLVEEAGAVRIYDFQNGSWQQVGNDIPGQNPRDLFGGAISLSADGNRIAVGSINNDNENGSNAGHVRIFDYFPETGWTESSKPLTGIAPDDQFGVALSLSADGKKLVVGSEASSYVRLFEYDTEDTYWRQVGDPIKRPREAGGGFGASVKLADKGTNGLIFSVGSPSVTIPVQLGQPDAEIGEIHLFEI